MANSTHAEEVVEEANRLLYLAGITLPACVFSFEVVHGEEHLVANCGSREAGDRAEQVLQRPVIIKTIERPPHTEGQVQPSTAS